MKIRTQSLLWISLIIFITACHFKPAKVAYQIKSINTLNYANPAIDSISSITTSTSSNSQSFNTANKLANSSSDYSWQSVTPSSVIVPIAKIGLIRQDGAEVALYTCSGSSESNCSIDLASNDPTNPIVTQILAGVSSIPSGTYTGVFLNTCVGNNSGFNASFRAEATIDSIRYVTTTNGVVASDIAQPTSMTVHYIGCQRNYVLPVSTTIAPGSSKTFQFYFDSKNIAWIVNGTSTTATAWLPSGCSASTATSSNSPFGCMAYPDLAATLGNSTPTAETYRVNSSVVLELFLDDQDNILSGFTRRYYEQGISFIPGFTADTPLKNFSKNASGGYIIENFGSTSTGHGYFKALNFKRTTHSDFFEDHTNTILPYTAKKVSGVSLDPTVNMPACDSFSNKPFTQLPFDSITRIRNIEPIGFLGPPGHTYPTDHSYFWFNKSNSSELVNLYAPGNIRVHSIESTEFLVSNFRQGLTDYSIRFLACKEIDNVIGHISTLQGPLANIMSTLDPSDCMEYDTAPGTSANEHIKRCTVKTILDVPAITGGNPTWIAQVSGSTAKQMDWGAFDSRVSNSFVNSSRFYQSMIRATCPLLYGDNVLQSQVEAKLGFYVSASTGVIPSTFNPLCGTTSVDMSHTAQGIWVQSSSPAFGFVTEANQVVLAPHYVRPDRETFSIGNALPGIDYGTFHFISNHAGQINRRFSELTNGVIYCYETNSSDEILASPQTNISKTFLLRLDSDTQITLESVGNSSCGTGPWFFTGNSRQFIR